MNQVTTSQLEVSVHILWSVGWLYWWRSTQLLRSTLTWSVLQTQSVEPVTHSYAHHHHSPPSISQSWHPGSMHPAESSYSCPVLQWSAAEDAPLHSWGSRQHGRISPLAKGLPQASPVWSIPGTSDTVHVYTWFVLLWLIEVKGTKCCLQAIVKQSMMLTHPCTECAFIVDHWLDD